MLSRIISPRLLHISTRKKPLWFTYLEDIILDNNDYRPIIPYFKPTGINRFAYLTNPFSKSDKPWVLTFHNEDIIISQICKTFTHTNTISITHWQHNIDTSAPYCYPLSLAPHAKAAILTQPLSLAAAL